MKSHLSNRRFYICHEHDHKLSKSYPIISGVPRGYLDQCCILYIVHVAHADLPIRRNITVATVANDIAILSINPKVASKMFEKGIRDIHKAD